ncbi:MAG: peptidylprolyl isomerase [Planctomycetaceae bacterium]|nr:MAG: peptidylprolyl isomerase [Planctomycetaceae bacterium]
MPDDVEAIRELVKALQALGVKPPPAPAHASPSPAFQPDRARTDLPDTVRIAMQTSQGQVMLLLYTQAAPYTVSSIVTLARKGFFRGLPFHRVVPNFVVQGGDPRGDGWGGPGYSIRSEFSPLRYGRGTIGMASAGKDTEGSQFFVTHSPQPHLDGRYTIIGEVGEGMDIVDRLQADDTIRSMAVLP